MYIKQISSLADAKQLLQQIEVDPIGIEIMSKKMLKRIIKIKDLDIRAANVLKQEALAAGGDLAVPKKAWFLKEKKVDAVLMMDQGNWERLLKKLKIQAFGLPEVSVQIEQIVSNFDKNKFVLESGQKKLILDKPVMMGVLNMTPDSFSDGGKFDSFKNAKKRIEQMAEEGAQIIDIGGESTGPRSKEVKEKEELNRIIPIIRRTCDMRHATCGRIKIWISVDTYKVAVAKQALKAGADMINDVTALRSGGREMGELIAKHKVPVVLMYAKDNSPRTTVKEVHYKNVMEEIGEFLQKRINFALACGIKKEQIIIDPGMGMFVSSEPKYSWKILERLAELKSLSYPILIGASRKSFLGGKIDDRLIPGLKAALIAVQNGAKIIRTHDVKETKKISW